MYLKTCFSCKYPCIVYTHAMSAANHKIKASWNRNAKYMFMQAREGPENACSAVCTHTQQCMYAIQSTFTVCFYCMLNKHEIFQ